MACCSESGRMVLKRERERERGRERDKQRARKGESEREREREGGKECEGGVGRVLK